MSLLSSFDRAYPTSSRVPLPELQLPSDVPDFDHHLTCLPISPLSAAAAAFFDSHDHHHLHHSTITISHDHNKAALPPFSDPCSGYSSPLSSSSSDSSDSSSYAASPPRFSFDEAAAAAAISTAPPPAFPSSAPSATAVTATTARPPAANANAAPLTLSTTTTTDAPPYYSSYDSDYCPSTRSTSPASSYVHASPKLDQQAFAAATGFDSPPQRHNAHTAQPASYSTFASFNQSASMPYFTEAQQQQLQQGAPMYQRAPAMPLAYETASSPAYMQQAHAQQQQQQYYYNQAIQRQQQQQQQQQQAQRHMYAQQQQAQMSHLQHQQQHQLPQPTPVAVAPAFETTSGTYYFVPSTAINTSLVQAAEPWSVMQEQMHQPRPMMSQPQQQQQQQQVRQQPRQLPAHQTSPVVSAPVAPLSRADSPLAAPLARAPVRDHTISGLTMAASTIYTSRSHSNSPAAHSEVGDLLPTQSDAPPSPKVKAAKATTKSAPKTRAAKRGGRRGAFYSESTGKFETKRFVCPYEDCGRAFSRNFNMQSHLKSHLNIRDFDCPCCPKKFSRRHDRARHCAAVHDMHDLADSLAYPDLDHQSTSTSSHRRSSIASSGDEDREESEFDDDKADSTYRG
ncbi:BQ2448_5548 [Microbotryum intermedium]|uniref:BQ2448_5548 protein n=1 Tax=Microbotryum intermedium TaxID=269621 RepID=A0A238EYD8_9BASI|nr:BQ2448_5548 [Microbotryum intermedium]